jgi:hypothetical protein
MRHHHRTNHLQHPPNAVISSTTAFNERRPLNRFPIIALVIRLGLRHVGERWIVLAVVAAHFVNHQVERRHDDEREVARAGFPERGAANT